MTRKLLVVAFILFCLNKINGQKIYEKDPGFLGSLGGDQVPSNGQEYSNDRVNAFHILLMSSKCKTHHSHFLNVSNYNFQYIDVPSISLDYNRLPFWYAKNKGPDDSLDDHRSNLLGNYILSKRYELMEPNIIKRYETM